LTAKGQVTKVLAACGGRKGLVFLGFGKKSGSGVMPQANWGGLSDAVKGVVHDQMRP